MNSEEATVAVDAGVLAGLQSEINQLADLFKRRLLEDRSKNALIESVQEQVHATNDLLKYRDFESLFKEALLAIDRLQSEPSTPELVGSVVDELLEVFRRRDLMEIDGSGDFDPRVHEAVGTMPAGVNMRPNTIAAVHRAGYFLGNRLLRPAQVTIIVDVDDRTA